MDLEFNRAALVGDFERGLKIHFCNGRNVCEAPVLMLEGGKTLFDEAWHLVKPLDGSREWAIAGIQQTA